MKSPLTAPARDTELANPDPLAEDVFKALEKTMASSSITIEHSNSGKKSGQKESKEEHTKHEKTASSTHILNSNNSTKLEKRTGFSKPLKKRVHSVDVMGKKAKSRLFERLKPHKGRTVSNFPTPEALKIEEPVKKKKKTVNKLIPGDFPEPRNLTEIGSRLDFPRPPELSIASEIPMLEKLPIRKVPHDFPRPKKFPALKISSTIPKPGALPIKETLSIFPLPKKLPDKEFPLNFPKPENITAGHFAGVLPKPTRHSTKKASRIFPSPETLPTKEFPLDFPEPRTTLPTPSESESIDEPPNSATSVEFPEPSDLTIISHSSKFPKPRKLVKKLPITSFPQPGNLSALPITSFPQPGNFSANPQVLTIINPGKLVPTPRWLGFPRPEELPTSGGSNDTLTIVLPSSESTKSESDSTDLSPNQEAFPRPIFLSLPFPQPLPLNVTITHKKVRRYRKKIHRTRTMSKLRHKKTTDEDVDLEKSWAAKKSPWKIRMIPKPLAKPAVHEALTGAPEIEPEGESLESTPLPDESLVDAVDVAESIDEPISVKSEDVVELPKLSVEATTEWAYATAPGERTAAPELLAAQAAEDSVAPYADNSDVNGTPETNVLESVDEEQQQENSVDEPEVLATTEHYVVAPEPYLPHDSE